MNDVVESVKPVYKTGESVGNIVESNAAVASQPPVTPTPTPEPIPAHIAETPTAPIVAETAPVETPTVPSESNASNFSIPTDFDTPTIETPAAAPVVADWREAIKKADLKEVLKELGVDEFAIEMNEHRKNGGDVLDYLNAKAVDYNKISDEDILKADLKRQYPSFTPDQIDLLFEDKYLAGEDEEDRKKQIKELNLKADAYNSRQSKITEQQKFKIPAAQVANTGNQAAQVEYDQRVEAARQWFADHEATKNLISSKRVTLNLGDNGTFNFNIDRPELLMKAVTDGESWQKLTRNKQGEPDVAKMQRIALYAFDPDKYDSSLVNFGRSLALPKLLEEGQNVQPGAKVIPVQGMNPTEKDAWKNARSSTIGGR